MNLADKTPFQNDMTVYMAQYSSGKPCNPVAYHNVTLPTHTSWGEKRDSLIIKCGSAMLWPFECYATEQAAKLAWLKSFKRDLSRNKKRLISLRKKADNLEQWINEYSTKP